MLRLILSNVLLLMQISRGNQLLFHYIIKYNIINFFFILIHVDFNFVPILNLMYNVCIIYLSIETCSLCTRQKFNFVHLIYDVVKSNTNGLYDPHKSALKFNIIRHRQEY